MTWQLPDTYHLAGSGRGTATLKFYEDRDILVAATAIWLNVPLVAHDAIFANVKDLHLLTKLDL
jgi:predicted nucleic acid-binding protein